MGGDSEGLVEFEEVHQLVRAADDPHFLSGEAVDFQELSRAGQGGLEFGLLGAHLLHNAGSP